MKVSKLFIGIAIASVALVSCNKKGGSVKLKNEADSVSYCIGVSMGQQLKNLDVTDMNNDIFNQAVKDMIAGKEAALTQEQIGQFLNAYFMKLQTKNAEKALKEGNEFLAKNKERKEVKTTASGLQYEVIKEGNGAVPTKEDMVSVHYKGTLINGETFDSSYERNQPVSFAVSGVIPGWTEALQLMKVGSKYKVVIPSELAYGANPPRGSKIKPNSVLVFEMELLSIDKQQAQQAQPKK